MANHNANGRVPVGRQVNGKALNADISLNAGDVGTYNKEESNQRFQLKGNYLTAGYSYSKNESDGRYQPKGNYAPAGNYAIRGESYTRGESDGRYQSRGNTSLLEIISQRGIMRSEGSVIPERRVIIGI
ncbi:protein of unknown function [Xenorhabdus poinarii G6]|uniref:Uncharacterized protein n=1 Tax=Xenorhabdus poinarii G6 TaxID=1354304 RepID=A0A068QZU9_9GAMM|nr:protein of unknown function [Xenorhabdus poinarii G6]